MLFSHTSVLLKEVLSMLSPKDGGLYVDATFGAGGYSEAILQSADCEICAVDRDVEVRPFYEKLLQKFPNKIQLYIDEFSNLKSIIANYKKNADAVLFDIGVSSMQIDCPDRGFSFMKDGPLDMRMGMTTNKLTAKVFVNELSECAMADIIYNYGGERYARKVARAIVCERKRKTINTTKELADIVRSVVFRSRKNSIDPATRTFQAIRIWVNDELEELRKGIIKSSEILAPNGKIIVVSFHSLEDRIVKRLFYLLSGKNIFSNEDVQLPAESGRFVLINKKVIIPTYEEIKRNTRSRSAKLRGVCKV